MTLGTWELPRCDPSNCARASGAGRMVAAPRERWSMPTGAEIRFARTVTHSTGDAVLVQTGTTLQLLHWTGRQLWSYPRNPVRRVLHIGRAASSADCLALVALDKRTVALIDIETGNRRWTWQTDAGSDLTHPGASKVYSDAAGGARWVCFPTYATEGVCVDLDADVEGTPSILWRTSLGAAYDAGFGPNVVVADMFDRGMPDVVISSRTGTGYLAARDGTISTDQLVLGRENGLVYQAVIDGRTGCVLTETRYEVDPSQGYPCARPYGLLHAAPLRTGQLLDLVLVSCQVEEYAAVAVNDGARLSRAWGTFVERDWPEDRRELRPQVTSVAELDGTDMPLLALGLWEDGRWSTIVVDPVVGMDEGMRARIEDRYFWGCFDLDGDGRAELVVSDEYSRTPKRWTSLEALDGRTLEVKARLDDVSVFTSTDSELPSNVNVFADRQSPVVLREAGGAVWLLVRRRKPHAHIVLWGGGSADVATRLLAEQSFTRADWRNGELVLSDHASLQRFDAGLRPTDRIHGVHGRNCTPLVWSRRGRPELVVDLADGSVVGGSPGPGNRLLHRWEARGRFPALHTDDGGTCRLAVADSDDEGEARVVVHVEPGSSSASLTAIPLAGPADIALVPFGAAFHLLANVRTGTHTTRLAVYDSDGHLCWEDRSGGAHPQRPAVADTPGGPFVVADDHGILRIYDPSGRVVATSDWTAAYTTPVVVRTEAGDAAVLRTDGIHGVELVDFAGATLWRRPAPLWHFFPGASAVGRIGRGRRMTLAAVSRAGALEAIDVATGEQRWTIDVGAVPSVWAVAAGDIDGDGSDEFLVGTAAGQLLCIAEDALGCGVVRWRCELGAAVTNPVIADLDGDGAVEILVSTADGHVRLLAADTG